MPVLEYSPQRKAWIFKSGEVPALSANKPTIAVYHTHSDESYVPTDGTESKPGRGGIYDVGQSLVQQLKKLGFNVEYSENNHNPHDVNAYTRRAVRQLLCLRKTRSGSGCEHRDATPPEQYRAEVKSVRLYKQN
jgi:stage II sporulation protein P